MTLELKGAGIEYFYEVPVSHRYPRGIDLPTYLPNAPALEMLASVNDIHTIYIILGEIDLDLLIVE